MFCEVFVYGCKPRSVALVLLFGITGALQIVIGSGLIWYHTRYTPVIDSSFWKPALLLLFLGPAVFVLCWFGWNATERKHRLYLGLFSTGLVIVLCLLFWITGWAIALRESLPHAAEFAVDQSYHDFLYNTSNPDQLWTKMQTQVKCCGVYGVIDYRKNKRDIPLSCCSRSDDPHEGFCKHVFQRGCLEALSDETKQGLMYCALTAVGCAILQSFGVFCIIQMVVLLGQNTNYDVERPPSQSCTPPERPKELMPLAKKPHASIPIPIPKVPSPATDKKYKATGVASQRRSTDNGNQ